MSRRAFQPTDDQRKNVRILAAYAIPQEQICALVRNENGKAIALMTLRKHFEKELEMGAVELRAQLTGFAIATIKGQAEAPEGFTPFTDEKARMSLYTLYMRTHGGWQETVRQEHANAKGPDGKPEPFVYVANKTDAKL